jgi:hypothetical protein
MLGARERLRHTQRVVLTIHHASASRLSIMLHRFLSVPVRHSSYGYSIWLPMAVPQSVLLDLQPPPSRLERFSARSGGYLCVIDASFWRHDQQRRLGPRRGDAPRRHVYFTRVCSFEHCHLPKHAARTLPYHHHWCTRYGRSTCGASHSSAIIGVIHPTSGGREFRFGTVGRFRLSWISRNDISPGWCARVEAPLREHARRRRPVPEVIGMFSGLVGARALPMREAAPVVHTRSFSSSACTPHP